MKMGKMYLILAIMAAFAMATTAQAGLLAHWDLNEGTGTTAADVTGNGYDGTLENVTWGAGVEGSAILFDQATANDGKVIISDPDDDLSAGDLSGGGGWSLSLWTKMSNLSAGTSNDVFYMEKTAGTDYSFLRVMSSGSVRFYYKIGNVAVYSNYATNSDGTKWLAASDEWNHLVVTIEANTADLISSQVKFYIDGVDKSPSASTINLTTSLALAGSTKTIGSAGYALGDGDMVDDVRIFDHALSAAEVADLYSVPEPATLLLLSLGGVFLRRRG